MKQELDGVKKSLRDIEKSLEAAWDSINDIQEETKTHNDYKKTCQQSLDSHRQELDLLKVNLKKVDSQQAEIENLKTRLLEEQEKIIALENYSRRENLNICLQLAWFKLSYISLTICPIYRFDRLRRREMKNFDKCTGQIFVSLTLICWSF